MLGSDHCVSDLGLLPGVRRDRVAWQLEGGGDAEERPQVDLPHERLAVLLLEPHWAVPLLLLWDPEAVLCL